MTVTQQQQQQRAAHFGRWLGTIYLSALTTFRGWKSWFPDPRWHMKELQLLYILYLFVGGKNRTHRRGLVEKHSNMRPLLSPALTTTTSGLWLTTHVVHLCSSGSRTHSCKRRSVALVCDVRKKGNRARRGEETVVTTTGRSLPQGCVWGGVLRVRLPVKKISLSNPHWLFKQLYVSNRCETSRVNWKSWSCFTRSS